MKTTKDLSDLIILFIIITVILILGSVFNWVELIRELSLNNEYFDIIELLSAISVIGILTTIFAFRRWNEIKKEQVLKDQMIQDLIDSEKRLISTVELSPDTIIIHKDNTIVFMNQVGVYFFGANKIEELIGRDITDFIHPSYISKFNDRITRITKGIHRLPNIELLINRLDNTYINVELSSMMITYHDFPHIITIIRDITERKENEERLRESEERMQAILDNSSAIVFLKDLNGSYILVNREFEKKFNVNRDSIKWKNDFDIFPADIAQQFKENDNKVIELKQSITVEEIAHNNGFPRFYLTVKFPLYNAFGSIYAVCGIATDITDRKKSEETRSRLASIIESSEDAITSYDLEGKILTWNPGAEKIYGYTADEMIGKSFSIIIPDNNENEINNLIDKVKRGQKIVNFETQRITKENKVIYVSLSISPVKDDKNNITAASAIARDITYKKTIENEMRRYAEELALYNEELYVFSYAASHDLQEPLKNITKFVDFLKKDYYDKFDNDFKNQLEFIEDGTIRMYRLITDFLSYSRVNADRTKFENSDFNVLIKDAISNLKVAISESQASVTYNNLPFVYCNPLQLTQVFQNLISNAIKYQGEHKPEIKIDYEDKNNEWLFVVSDNGIGIEQWFHERIFLIFQKMHDHRKYPGSGIGLALCKRVIEKHGGKIWFESVPGKGTTFYFTIKKSDSI